MDLKKNVEIYYHKEDFDDLYQRLQTNPETGLSLEQVKKNLHEFGLNKLTPPPSTPIWIKFLKELTGFFSLLVSFITASSSHSPLSPKGNLLACS